MDVELQVLKHLARDAHPTVALVDEYCAEYKDLFKEVRNYECFKYLHLGIIAPIKRKSLPEIAVIGEYKLCTVITSFYSQFRLVSRAIKKTKIKQGKESIKGKGHNRSN
jgi:SRSO17 transposase